MPRLLLVEDDEAFRERLARALEERGFSVRTADCARAAAECAIGQLDAAVVDLRLGTESGLDVLTDLRRRSGTLRLVLLTGHPSAPAQLSALKLGAVVVRKPAEIDEIVRAVSGQPLPDDEE